MVMILVRVFGYVAFVHLHKNQHSKLDPCAIRCVFLKYAIHEKSYQCHDAVTKKMYETMDVTFLESETLFTLSISNSLF